MGLSGAVPTSPEIGAPGMALVWFMGVLLLWFSLDCCWHICGLGWPSGWLIVRTDLDTVHKFLSGALPYKADLLAAGSGAC